MPSQPSPQPDGRLETLLGLTGCMKPTTYHEITGRGLRAQAEQAGKPCTELRPTRPIPLARHDFWGVGDRAYRHVRTQPVPEQLTGFLIAGPARGRRAALALTARLGAGAVFVAFGAGKFASHAAEADSFERYGLPHPDTFVYAIGALELVGGALLIVGLATRLAALGLAGDMVGAIIVSGILRGEAISLTLAPAQLAAMLYLLWAGPGCRALDRRLASHAP